MDLINGLFTLFWYKLIKKAQVTISHYKVTFLPNNSPFICAKKPSVQPRNYCAKKPRVQQRTITPELQWRRNFFFNFNCDFNHDAWLMHTIQNLLRFSFLLCLEINHIWCLVNWGMCFFFPNYVLCIELFLRFLFVYLHWIDVALWFCTKFEFKFFKIWLCLWLWIWFDNLLLWNLSFFEFSVNYSFDVRWVQFWCLFDCVWVLVASFQFRRNFIAVYIYVLC